METPPRKTAPVVWMLLILLALIGIGAAGYYYWQYQDLLKHPEKLGTQEVSTLVTRVSGIIELPTGEEPQLATVTDVEAVKKDQPFFTNAENGDKVLIYKNAKKAFLYRPSANKIIEVGPVTLGEDAAGTTTEQPSSIQSQTTNPATNQGVDSTE